MTKAAYENNKCRSYIYILYIYIYLGKTYNFLVLYELKSHLKLYSHFFYIFYFYFFTCFRKYFEEKDHHISFSADHLNIKKLLSLINPSV